MTLDEYVGLPFKDKGRDRSGLDCWGLLRLVYQEKAGLTLPAFVESYVTQEDTAAVAALIAGHSDGWREVAEPTVKPLDAVLMLQYGVERHIGVVVKRGLVLHVGLGGASRIEPYNSMRLRRRVSRFMRHEALR
jgi:cell wall-associated NlpC family hydrolase